MSVILKPADCSARSALSRPAPGPFTNTATERMPFSIARRAASSAASCAANGVLLREPLKPRAPALAHDTVFPATSVTVTMVLLKVDRMCATPVGMFLRATRFDPRFLVWLVVVAAMSASAFYACCRVRWLARASQWSRDEVGGASLGRRRTGAGDATLRALAGASVG